MPTRVRLFWYLAIVHFLIELGWAISHFTYTSGRYGGLVFVGGEVIGLATLGAAWLIAYRKIGWLRWLIAASYVLSLFDTSWTHSPSRLFLLYLPQSIVDVAAIHLVFFGDAADWFSDPDRKRNTGLFYKAASGVCGVVLGLAVVSSLVGTLVSLFHSPSAPKAATTGSQGDGPYTTTEAVLANHPDIRFISDGDPELGKSIRAELDSLAAKGPFVEGKVRDIYKKYIGPVAANADRDSLVEYGKARLALFEGAQQTDAHTCFRVAVGLYGETTGSILSDLREKLGRATAAAYQSGKQGTNVPLPSSDEYNALLNKVSLLPQGPFDEKERRGINDPNATEDDLCRRMVHLQSNVLLMDDADSIAMLRKEISLLSN